MRIGISVAAVLACALSLDAQIAATLSHSSDGSDVVRIRNNSAISLAAFVVSVRHMPESADASRAPFVMFSDPVVDSTEKPMLASEERVVMGWGIYRFGERINDFLEEPIVAAGILSDGTTTGDPGLLTRLILRRSNMLLAVDTALAMLSDAGIHNAPRDHLIGQFVKAADSLNHWYLPPEQQVGRGLYLSMAAKLRDLPEAQVGAPFPPASFVAQEAALLRQERTTLLESEPGLLDTTPVSRDSPPFTKGQR